MAFDLFEALGTISGGDLEWFDKLSEDDKKAAAPFVIGRWLTGTSDQAQLIRLNTFVNPYIFSLGSDKSLLFKLLAASCTGRTKRYFWLKAPSPSAATKLKLEVIKSFYDVSSREAVTYSSSIADEEIVKMAEELGFDKDEMAKLKKELSDGQGSAEKVSTKSKK